VGVIDTLHIIRPLWLLALPVVALVWWLVRQRDRSRAEVTAPIAPHLRDALTINRGAKDGFRAVDSVAVVALFGVIAAAGPSWTQQASPWFEETAPLVIAVEVTDSMRSNDWLPTRLDRARFKILDLLQARTGSRSALVAYAGSAHIVVPPSRDIEILKPFLEGLDPAIMPVQGSIATAVLPMARKLLGDEYSRGTLMFVNDGFDAGDLPGLAAFANEPGSPAMTALVIGDDKGGVALMPDGAPVMAANGGRLDTSVDVPVLRRAEVEAGISVVRATPGDGDIRTLLRRVESNLRQADDPDANWVDEGWWFLWPALFMAAFWFRRGWTMQW
jgi:Ca-activated chloride channel family protein